MHVKSLDHVNIRTTRYDEAVAFYRDSIGLQITPPPTAKDISNSAWVHDASGRPIIHLVRAGQVVSALGSMEVDDDAAVGTGPLHHVALDCADYENFRNHLEASGRELRFNDIPQAGLRQIFVRDPNGLLVELNFR
ncbi:MAG: VOC family protein [Sphingobium phenoxybenzoativorans]|uniref:VOC family protein n=1 Tax=Sphingobium phenoxybenzoativorans TaxID=1592790 RepID=UPI00087218CA|nr:VOC family protein [Sphingobium phenoxybenzoativorans]